MPLSLHDFRYVLPENRIAQEPASPRDASKLLVLNRQSGSVTHSVFNQLGRFLRPGDVLVRNNTKVIPARLYGKKQTGGAVEVLLNKVVHHSPAGETWEVLSKPGLKPRQQVVFSDALHAECLGFGSDTYTRLLQFNMGGSSLLTTLHTIGELPLPPYINTPLSPQAVADRYQTTYASAEGSAAAPTAGLHFTPELDAELERFGVSFAEVTLHVGLGTFLPVTVDDVSTHHMHAEYFELNEKTAKQLTAAKTLGNRVIAVGTTTVRTLESCVTKDGVLESKTGETDIFLYPPFEYKVVDGIITNFHLPESTLLMLVSAFTSAPNTRQEFRNFSDSHVGKAYAAAIQNNYRFFSFGDAMLIT